MTHFMEFWLGSGLSVADLVVLGIIFIGLPIIGELSMRRYPPHKAKDDPDIRLMSYNLTLLMLWSVALSVLIAWGLNSRALSDLGFKFSYDLPTIIVMAVTFLITGYFLAQLIRVASSTRTRSKMRDQINRMGDEVILLMPRTAPEHRRSMLVAVTAGITEEIIFRGYVIWVFSQILPVWGAGLISCLIFVFLHRYQSREGVAQVAVFTIIATIMYIACGSLWPVIFLHIAVDVLMLTTAWVVNSSDELPEAA